MKLLSTFLSETSGSRERCPDENFLAGFAEGSLLPGERKRTEAHLAECAACREALVLAATLFPSGPRPAVDGRAGVPFRAWVTHSGSRAVERCDGFVLAALALGQAPERPVFRSGSGPVGAEPGGPPAVRCLLLPQAPSRPEAEVRLQITDGWGGALTGVQVQVRLESGDVRQGVTDGEGRILLEGLEDRQIAELELKVTIA